MEDSNTGFDFYEGISDEANWAVVSANGKSDIFSEVVQTINEEKILVIADGAVFEPEMNRMAKLIQERENVALYLPESFEWLILKFGVLNDRIVCDTVNFLVQAYSGLLFVYS